MKRMKKSICRCLVLCFLLTSFAFGTGFDSEAKSGKWRQDKKGWYYSYSDGTYQCESCGRRFGVTDVE